MKIILSESVFLLIENRVDFLYDKYVKLDQVEEEIFQELKASDPTSNKEYLGWLLQIYMLDNLLEEDFYKAQEDLTLFHKIKNRLPEEDKNLYSLVTVQEKYFDTYEGKTTEKVRNVKKLKVDSLNKLYALIKSYTENVEQQKINIILDYIEKNKKDVRVAYQDSNWLVVVPLNEQQACFFGGGTRWCTASKNNSQFNYYNKQGHLLININKNTLKKYQFHFESAQYMDEDDDAIDLGEFFQPYSASGLKGFYNKIWRNDILIEVLGKSAIADNTLTITKQVAASLFGHSSDFVLDVLSGDAYQYFDTPHHVDNNSIRHMLSDVNKENLELSEFIIKKNGNWDEEEDLEYNILDDYDVNDAYSSAIRDAQSSADESEAYEMILNKLKKHFGATSYNFNNEDKLVFTLDIEKIDAIDLYIEHLNGGNDTDLSFDERETFYGDIDELYFNELLNEKLSEIEVSV